MKQKTVAIACLLVAILCAGVVGAAPLTGKISQWKHGKEVSLSGATVVVGKGIWLDTSKGMYDYVRGGSVAGKTGTDSSGNYSLDLPPGKYKMIIWKGHYVPADGIDVTVPGTEDGSISYDDQVGSSSRHHELHFAK